MSVSAAELLALWHGDDLSTGFWSEEIVVRLCEIHGPSTPSTAMRMLYPDEDAPDDAREMIARGYKLWKQRAQLPARKATAA